MSIKMVVHPKTIYTDIVSMPDPMLLGVTIHYYNQSDGTLYMKIYGSGTGWSSNSVQLGSLTTGTNDWYNLDNFLSRSKPASATTETITLTLKGYSDAGYTTEVYSFSRSVTVIFIKSDDGTWTTDDEDNFDDGTTMGWSGNALGLGVSAAFALSPPYSLYGYSAAGGGIYADSIRILRDAVILIQISKPAAAGVVPVSTWLRFMVPLPSSTTLTLTVEVYSQTTGTWRTFTKSITTPSRTTIYAIINLRVYSDTGRVYQWMDDFKLISK